MNKQDYIMLATAIIVAIIIGLTITSIAFSRTDEINRIGDCVQESNVHGLTPEQAWNTYADSCRQ